VGGTRRRRRREGMGNRGRDGIVDI